MGFTGPKGATGATGPTGYNGEAIQETQICYSTKLPQPLSLDPAKQTLNFLLMFPNVYYMRRGTIDGYIQIQIKPQSTYTGTQEVYFNYIVHAGIDQMNEFVYPAAGEDLREIVLPIRMDVSHQQSGVWVSLAYLTPTDGAFEITITQAALYLTVYEYEH
jgi:hypothetical protein